MIKIIGVKRVNLSGKLLGGVTTLWSGSLLLVGECFKIVVQNYASSVVYPVKKTQFSKKYQKY